MNVGIGELKRLGREIHRLEQISALLGWDQETYMPVKAIGDRAEQQSLIQGIIHSKITDSGLGKFLKDLGADLESLDVAGDYSDIDRALIRHTARIYKKAVKLPKDLVERTAREESISQARWIDARRNSDFSIFAPHLKVILDLKRETADLLGYDDERYDALLDDYEPWMKTREIVEVFSKFQKELREFIEKINSSNTRIDDSFLYGDYDIEKQEAFGKEILSSMGYDFNRGRLDVSAHPFTTSLGYDDTRLTTRYKKNNFKTGIFGIIHECGHGLYELGFPDKIKGTLLADGTSMGIHESQSRMWENIIGRSRSFWKTFFPKLRGYFPEVLKGVSLDEFHRAVNVVLPTLIRVEADEVTYNMHIIIRFNLERRLLNEELAVDELPGAWNHEYGTYLGIEPENDSEGVLQDIHWSGGMIGYFPTYTLGNLYAAQFYNTLKEEIPDLESELERGNLKIVLDWLREKIHRHGSVYSASDLCRMVTGESVNPGYFMSYLDNKYRHIYDL